MTIRTIQKIRIQKIMIKNRKVYLNFIFNFIFINLFICTVISSAIVYYYSLNLFQKDVRGVVRNNFKFAYFLPFILAKYHPTITPETEPIISYSFSMFILSLLVLICFFNIISYIFSIYLISKYDIENKFPFFKRYIQFYNSTSKFLLILEILIAFVFLIFIVLINFFLFTSVLFI